MKRGKAKEDLLRKSSSGVGAPPDLAETLPMSPHMAAPVEPFPLQDSQDKQTVEYIPEDSQAPVDDVVLMEQDGEVQFQAAEGGAEEGEQAEEERQTDDEVVEPIVCHEDVPEYTEMDETKLGDTPMGHGAIGSKEDTTGKGHETRSKSPDMTLRTDPPASPAGTQLPESDMEEDHSKNRKGRKAKDAKEATVIKGTHKDSQPWSVLHLLDLYLFS